MCTSVHVLAVYIPLALVASFQFRPCLFHLEPGTDTIVERRNLLPCDAPPHLVFHCAHHASNQSSKTPMACCLLMHPPRLLHLGTCLQCKILRMVCSNRHTRLHPPRRGAEEASHERHPAGGRGSFPPAPQPRGALWHGRGKVVGTWQHSAALRERESSFVEVTASCGVSL
jgi:hypothetical protein